MTQICLLVIIAFEILLHCSNRCDNFGSCETGAGCVVYQKHSWRTILKTRKGALFAISQLCPTMSGKEIRVPMCMRGVGVPEISLHCTRSKFAKYLSAYEVISKALPVESTSLPSTTICARWLSDIFFTD